MAHGSGVPLEKSVRRPLLSITRLAHTEEPALSSHRYEAQSMTVLDKQIHSYRLKGVFGDNKRYFLLILHKNLSCDPSLVIIRRTFC